jgi:hypothetical protein
MDKKVFNEADVYAIDLTECAIGESWHVLVQ